MKGVGQCEGSPHSRVVPLAIPSFPRWGEWNGVGSISQVREMPQEGELVHGVFILFVTVCGFEKDTLATSC